MGSMPKLLIGFGAILVLTGILLLIVGKVPFLGKLPGDINIRKDNFTFYFPLTTCLLISVFLTLVLGFWGKK